MASCIVCKREAQPTGSVWIDNIQSTHLDCPRCGQYTVPHPLSLSQFSKQSFTGWWLVSSRIRAATSGGGRVVLTDEVLERYRQGAPPSVRTRLDTLLRLIESKSEHINGEVTVDLWTDCALVGARDAGELASLLMHLKDQGFVTFEYGGQQDLRIVTLTMAGWLHLQNTPADGGTVFVAMWFDASMDLVKNAIREAIEVENALKQYRVDERNDTDEITDQIITGIHNSGLVVADVTGARPSVYFEAGYAIALHRPVVFTCSQDTHKTDMHFDTSHYPHIIYEDAADLRAKLAKRIAAIVAARRS